MRLIYDVADRQLSGYRGRWRYRVTVHDASKLPAYKVVSALFKRRMDAASYASQSELKGSGGGARYLSAIGAREGDAFKIELIRDTPIGGAA